MLGVCYYPEQWPRQRWPQDVAAMAELGLSYVRLGEFSWTRLEPQTDQWDGEWLDQVLDLLLQHKLKAVLGTPTAAPPKWLVDRYPEILPVDSQGRVRRFGSRRHSCFSSPAWHQESERIVSLVAHRYGQHEAVVGWQTDNEYGGHDTVRCYCPRCKLAFRNWLSDKYGGVEALNEAWGNTFWSQAYRTFEEIDLPFLSVTSVNPSHRLDYFRFASDQVAKYNRKQVDLLRAASPGRFITHNFLGFFSDLDTYAVARDLDFASWDSYPLAFTEKMPLNPAERRQWARTGHPDAAAWHHDLYRSVGRGRYWVMEQQPGPVNWGVHNPAPAPGVVRLWTWEAMAHGAECISYFRWRQAHQGQEQMHAGLLRPDHTPDLSHGEVKRVAQERAHFPLEPVAPSSVAILYDYEAAWMGEILPHGATWDYSELVMNFYSAVRGLGLNVDVVKPGDDLSNYKLVLAPSLPVLSAEVTETLKAPQFVVLGPRSGSKTPNLGVASGPFGMLRVESLPPEMEEHITWRERSYPVRRWREELGAQEAGGAHFEDGTPAVGRLGNIRYLAFWPDPAFLTDWLEELAHEAGLQTTRLAPGIRLRQRGKYTFCFNYSTLAQPVPAPADATFVLGGATVEPRSLCVWVKSSEFAGATPSPTHPLSLSSTPAAEG